ncbi:glutamate-ammonia-ligase adenylyltransferase [Cognatiyoonia koreensis]|uniref:Glutamate-ammonia-ligase adenylyltransferase n=1 Tax=Cognatiyoonia koreensis TaxID=364200 RepID=A0A1I0NUP3_9RHOB|nr:glutamine-synthetase adenylyltransferase [Cognatiyoonia koreensis]SEW05361.1 glutamate-ammonia-ligase adenylyltransferase [Cognatiyoonia koreensis]
MSFAAHITRAPDAFDKARADDVMSDIGEFAADVMHVLHGAAGCSPYLGDLMRSETDWLPEAFDDPAAALVAVNDAVRSSTTTDMHTVMRQAKRRTALLTALADLGGVWPLETVTQALTDFANTCVDHGIRTLVAAEIARGKLPGMGDEDAATSGGMCALAMGKMGAGELNYSSDIDLICLFDETRFDPDDYFDARAVFIRVTRRLTAILSDTKGGYVFRTDLRLRPDASVTPVCLSMETAERYYESVGRTWERAAYIKAAPSGGDVEAALRFLKTLDPFVWRKHLDFAAIQDAHDMRLRIRDHKGLGGALSLEGHDMKLGRGGIREIEFFTQTRQLIAGGRDPSLRVRGTGEGLTRLAAAGWISADAAATLYTHYKAHREIEHRLQMVNDAQTHTLPTDAEGFQRLACFTGQDINALRSELEARLEEVHALTEGFFTTDDPADDAPAWGNDITARWRTYPALRSDRGSAIFKRIGPDILSRLQKAAKPEEALVQFDAFLAGLPAGVQLFSLFEANPQLSQLIVDICATAPALAQYLSRNAGVFDAVIGGSFFGDWPGQDALKAELTANLDAAADYEAQLNAARRWMKEWHFRIGVHHLRGLIDADTAATQYADLAEAAIAALWPPVCAEFARKFGGLPGQGAVVLGMGSLGAARLNAESDLDLIVIYDADGVEASDGRRSLPTRTYYARLTQALVTALSAPMAEGRLYEVDMRLRPSGRQGPVATALQAFRDYQSNDAWTWEHLALTRARAVAGAAPLGQAVEDFRRTLLPAKGQGESVLQDVADMRARLAAAKPAQSVWDMKSGPGHLQDIELLAQTAALIAGSPATDTASQIAAGVAAGWLDAADAQALTAAARLLWQVQAAGRLLTAGVLDPDAIGEGGCRMVLRETGFDTMDALQEACTTACTRAAEVIDRMIGTGT